MSVLPGGITCGYSGKLLIWADPPLDEAPEKDGFWVMLAGGSGWDLGLELSLLMVGFKTGGGGALDDSDCFFNAIYSNIFLALFTFIEMGSERTDVAGSGFGSVGRL
jgi:hypothetical protein